MEVRLWINAFFIRKCSKWPWKCAYTIFHTEYDYLDEEPPVTISALAEEFLKPGQDYTAPCRSTEPIEWRFVGVLFIHIDKTYFWWKGEFCHCSYNYFVFPIQYDKMNVASIDSYDENDEKPFKSVLRLTLVTHFVVGYYYCVIKSAMAAEFTAKIDNQWDLVSKNSWKVRHTSRSVLNHSHF